MPTLPIHDSRRPLVEHGVTRYGRFDGPIADANLIDSVPAGRCMSARPVRNMRLKEWEAVQIGTDRFFMILALFDGKLVGRVQAKIYDRRTRAKYTFDETVRSGSFRNTRNLLHTEASFRRGEVELTFRNRLRDGTIQVVLHLPQTPTSPSVDATFVFDASAVQPLVISLPFEDERGMYSHKGLHPVTGQIRVGDENIPLGEGDAYGLMDHHKGYYGRVMRWDWVTAAGWVDGSLVGFNLTRNASLDSEYHNENGFWIDGVFHPVGPVYFTRTQNGGNTWTVRDRTGESNLVFDIEVDGRVDLNTVVVHSRYRGPFGRFSGSLTSTDGTVLEVDDLFGMGEDFYLKA